MRKQKKRKAFIPMAELNLTPLVDVVFVLLMIFMISAPMLSVGVPVDLPKTKAASLQNDEKDPLVITINSQKEIFISKTQISIKNIIEKLNAITNNNQEITVYIRGDKNLSYGEVMNLMGTISEGGYTKVSLIADMPN
jgi:biopolymer transport protein TolR